MASSLFKIVSGNTTTLPQALMTASLDGWVVFHGLAVSGNTFFSLLGRGVGLPIPLTEETQSLNSLQPTESKGLWQSVFPFETSPGTLTGINTNPNQISNRT